MKMFRKRLLVLVMIASIVMNTSAIYAADDSEVSYDSEHYSMMYNYIVEAIMEDYLYIEDISEEELFQYAIQGIFDNLDKYSDFLEPVEEENLETQLNNSFVGIGVGIEENDGQVSVIKVYDGTPAEKAGVLAGDIFYIVNGLDVTGYSIDELLEILLDEEGTSVTVSFLRGEEVVEFTMVREKFNVSTAKAISFTDLVPDASEEIISKVGYVDLTSFGSSTASEFEMAIELMKEEGKEYLILDLRNNTGGYVNTALDICNQIVPAGAITTFVDSKGNETVYVSDLEEAPFEIVTLVNGWSASASEITTAAIQDSGVGVVVGEKTYGKGVAQYITPVGDGYYIKLTYQEFLSRDKNSINGVGITPDYLVDLPEYIYSDYRFYLNDSDEGVYTVETILSFLGYEPGEIDYNYDEATYEAIKSFQADMGLYPYGVCDYSTQDMLNLQLSRVLSEKDLQLYKAIEVIETKLNEENSN